MGLFDFFRAPTPERFAEALMKELRRQGVAKPLIFDSDNGRIEVGVGKDRGIINVPNLFKEYASVSRWERRRQVIRVARIFATAGEVDFPPDFSEARDQIRPKLWARALLENANLQAQIDRTKALDVPEYEIGSHLVASLVYDRPDSVQSINQEQLEEWGVTYYEALEIARDNLERTPCSYAKIGDGCYAFATGDTYDASRLLLPSRMAELAVKGDLIATAPNRDSSFVAGSEDPKSLQIIADVTLKALEQPRPMVPVPIRWDGNAWVDWHPPPGHPMERTFRDIARRFDLDLYDDQKRLLEQLHDKQGTDIFVASFTLVKKPDGSLYSYAVWSNGVKTLLPRAEWVMFVRGKDDFPAAAPWDRVEQIVGHQMKETDHYPTRVMVDKFPTDAELAALGKAEP
jgi:hypothetical protein